MRRGIALLVLAQLASGCQGGPVAEPDVPVAAASQPDEVTPAATSEPADAPSDESTAPATIADSFTDDFSGWDVVGPGQGVAGEIMGYKTSNYFMRIEPPNRGFASYAPKVIEAEPLAGDVAVEVDVRLDGPRGSAGVLCRGAADGSSGYLAAIAADATYGILRIGGNAPRPLTDVGATDPSLREVEDWNTLRLECTGSQGDTTLRLYLNDQLVAEVIDPEPLADGSEVGLFVLPRRRGDTFEALFDDFLAEPHAAST